MCTISPLAQPAAASAQPARSQRKVTARLQAHGDMQISGMRTRPAQRRACSQNCPHCTFLGSNMVAGPLAEAQHGHLAQGSKNALPGRPSCCTCNTFWCAHAGHIEKQSPRRHLALHSLLHNTADCA